MTQDEIIRMMKEAGFYFGKDDEFMPEWEIFAALVAAHEREACVEVCKNIYNETAPWNYDKGAVKCGLAIIARGEK